VSRSALLGETGRIPVSNANELKERNPLGEPTKQSEDERRTRPGGHADKRSVAR
jgi:hypothetical protein